MLNPPILALAVALSVNAAGCHHYNYERGEWSNLHKRQDPPPYPTGPGYDVVPLENIVPLPASYSSNAVTVPTQFPPGSHPPIPNAPPIPQFDTTIQWPQDWSVPPPTDSPQVKQWLKELDGHNIPKIPINKPVPKDKGNGVTCGDNPDAVKASGKDGACWWTCGGCIRDTDISTCKDKMTWGQTYDDGPGLYTPKLLAFLESKAIKATFFLIGGNVLSHPETVIYQHMTGHEIGIHTWSHPALTTLTNEQIVAELGWSREAIKQVTGVTPILFRPPYGDIDDRVRAIANAMKLTPVLWTTIQDSDGGLTEWDSADWAVHGGNFGAVENQNNFYGILDKSSSLDTGIVVLQHDIYVETVDIAIGATIPHALAANPPFTYKSVQVCQNTGIGNAYLETTEANPPVPSMGGSNNTSTANPNSSTTGTKTGVQTTTATRSTSISGTPTGGTGAANHLRAEMAVFFGFMCVVIAGLFA